MVISLSFSLSLLRYGNILFIFPIPCLAIPFGCRQCLFYHLCTLLGLCSLGMTMFDLLFLYLFRPYPWDVGNDWFIFFFCVLALCMLDIYIYIYICLFKDGHVLCWAIPFGCRQCLFYHSCTLLGPRSLGLAMSDLSFLYLVVPYLWNTGNVWFMFLLCVLLDLNLVV